MYAPKSYPRKKNHFKTFQGSEIRISVFIHQTVLYWLPDLWIHKSLHFIAETQAMYSFNVRIYFYNFEISPIISKLCFLKESPVLHLSSNTLITKIYMHAIQFNIYICA